MSQELFENTPEERKQEIKAVYAEEEIYIPICKLVLSWLLLLSMYGGATFLFSSYGGGLH